MSLFKRKPVTTLDRISHGLRTLSSEAREVLQSVNNDASSYGQNVRARLTDIADYAHEASSELERQVRRNVSTVNQVIHARPYECVGIAFGAGLLLGIIASRR